MDHPVVNVDVADDVFAAMHNDVMNAPLRPAPPPMIPRPGNRRLRNPFGSMDRHVQMQQAQEMNIEFLKASSALLVTKLTLFNSQMSTLISACTRVSGHADFFGKLSTERPDKLKSLNTSLHALHFVCCLMCEHAERTDETVGFALCLSDLDLITTTLSPDLNCIWHMFDSFEKLTEGLDTMLSTMLSSIPSFLGLPFNEQWFVDSCLRVSVNNKHELVFCGESPMCAICQDAFSDGETIMRFSRNCKHDAANVCSGPACTCKSALHPKCVSLMIMSDRNRHTFKSCPTCRADFCVKDLVLKTVYVPKTVEERSEANKRLLEITKVADQEADVDVILQTPEAPKRLRRPSSNRPSRPSGSPLAFSIEIPRK